MSWFGFGFNGFGQICLKPKDECDKRGNTKVLTPVPLQNVCSCDSSGNDDVDKTTLNPKDNSEKTRQEIKVVASWSRRASIHINGDRCVCVSGVDSASGEECFGPIPESEGCEDAVISERCLILRFPDRVECWSWKRTGKALAWSGVQDRTTPTNTSPDVTFPLVPGGYVATQIPFFRPLSPRLHAVSLILGTEHAVLLTASGTIYTWGSGSHGQLGHGSLTSEDEPRALEALWGVPMKYVAAGGWHSACISAGGDLYMWGWNESGQIGLPSKGVNEESQKVESPGRGMLTISKKEDGDSSNVFISIQAFPALVDVPEVSEISKVSCGSRHTVVITSTGDLYTWGWGQYGQLGHGSECSSDEPKIVEYFSSGGMTVEDVVCGLWNTFVCAVPRKCSP
ncbi:RCC1 domain-containing protein 1 isoform X1 [Electrophorus electricus]|uniref:RCC1 domain containing 1 n=1 Tax=Electrophorus electricus TaxID=8005 RepID=A0A4W4EBL2_ELEEL|nr:RCC1 domain-containing protein 1 isoform X1 [Electrophorus electricus]